MKPNVAFIPMLSSDLKEAFAKYKAALLPVIEEAFGWNEDFQRDRFETRYELSWFHWVTIDDRRVGYICYFQKPSEIHLSLLIIDSEFRGSGFGLIVMNHLHELARKDERKVTLSSFRNNKGAIKFYERLGYCATGSDEYFLDMELEKS